MRPIKNEDEATLGGANMENKVSDTVADNRIKTSLGKERAKEHTKKTKVNDKFAKSHPGKSKVPDTIAKDHTEKSQGSDNFAEDYTMESKVSDKFAKSHTEESKVSLIIATGLQESRTTNNIVKGRTESEVCNTAVHLCKSVLRSDSAASNTHNLQQSSCRFEPEDNVFKEERTERTPRQRHKATSDPPLGTEAQDNGDDLSVKSEDKKRLSSVTVQRCSQSWPQRNMSECALTSECILEMDETPSRASSGPKTSKKVLTYLENCESSEAQDLFPNMKRIRHRGRGNTSSHITVKYTKVYGESDGAYRNDSTPRGLVFISNFSKFKDNKHPEREGSEIDYENLLNLFQQMGYGYSHRMNTYCLTGYITKQEFMDKILKFSRERKHEVLCSCVVIIMSHGSGPKTFLTSDNQEVDLMEVYRIFDNIHCKLLKGKPKIFILQFCRNFPNELSDITVRRHINNDYDLLQIIREEVRKAVQKLQPHSQGDAATADIDPKSPFYLAIEEISRNASVSSLCSFPDVNISHVTDERESEEPSEAQHYGDDVFYHTDTRNLPAVPREGIQRYSDMYSIFSTSPGELSHRDPHKGSLLIQAICYVFAESAYQDEIDILVRKVSTYMTKTLQKDDPITVPRQTCERTNNGLDKSFYFNPEKIPFCRHVTI